MAVKLIKNIFKIDKTILSSRLIIGTGKYKNFLETSKAINASGADMVTVAVRRVNITDKKKTYVNRLFESKKKYFFQIPQVVLLQSMRLEL